MARGRRATAMETSFQRIAYKGKAEGGSWVLNLVANPKLP